jgi:hypothetical protein
MPPDLLAELRIASPCSASWEEMEGSDRVRFCRHCRKNVYNLSAMSRQDAATLVRRTEGRACVRFYRRRDGTLLTDNCPVGLRAARRWFLAQIGSLAALFGLLGGAAPLLRLEGMRRMEETDWEQVEPLPTLSGWRDRLTDRLDALFPGLHLRPPLVAMGRPPGMPSSSMPLPQAAMASSRRGRRRRRHPRSGHRHSHTK